MTQPREYFLGSYLADRAAAIVIALVCASSIGIGVHVLGCPLQAAFLLAGTVVLFAAASLAWDYVRRLSFYRQTAAALKDAEHAYYLPELLERPRFLEGQLLYDTCADIAASDAALLSSYRESTALMREYVELWTHEVKTPISAAKLTLARMHGDEATKLRGEIERIELACERALYSSRTTNLSRDYMIRETDLEKCCKSACKDLASLLIQSKAQPVFEFNSASVALADEQWTAFVVKQVVSNAAKYGAHKVVFSSSEHGTDTAHGFVALSIADDGIGIPAGELPSIFERGFSGSNGRAQGNSTGMGLYLAAQACKAMGVELVATSAEGAGTTIELRFPLDRSRIKTCG